MPRFEYTIAPISPAVLGGSLNHMGAEGWELITMHKNAATNTWVCVFKRQMEQSKK